MLGTIPTAILYFTTYEWCKAQLEARKAPSAVTHLASASAGAVMSAFIRVPTDTVKHRVQAYMETNVFLVSLPCSHEGWATYSSAVCAGFCYLVISEAHRLGQLEQPDWYPELLD